MSQQQKVDSAASCRAAHLGLFGRLQLLMLLLDARLVVRDARGERLLFRVLH
jgi:hypothetical protein